MKKIIFLLIPIILTSCFFSNDNDEVEKAKKEILSGEQNSIIENENININDFNQSDEITETIENEQTQSVNIKNISNDEWVIFIDDLNNKDFYTGEVWITWTVKWNVDKIEVSFSNSTSTYPSDLYELKQFKSGDTTFKYLASTHFETLDFGLNEYIFTAYSSWNTYKVKVEVNLPEKLNTSTTSYKKIDNLDDFDMPSSSTFWDPSLNDNRIITYANIENFFITKNNVENIKCDNLTEYLSQNFKFPYWNTCRDIIKDKSIGFYVLRLDWDNFKYEKHYVNYDLGLYWILLLEEWDWVTWSMLADKNKELKEKTFDQVLITDKLFKEMKK